MLRMKSLVPSSWGRRQIRSKAASSRSPLSPPLPPHQCQSFHLRFYSNFLLMLLFKLIFLLIGLYLHVFSFNPLAPPIGGAPSSKSALLGGKLFKIKIQNSKIQKRPTRRKSFQIKIKNCLEESFWKSNFKILMSWSDGDHFDLSQFVGCNQIHPIRVIKEVRAIIASTVDETTPQRSNIAEKKK